MSFVKNIDPIEFARRFSAKDGLPDNEVKIRFRGSFDQVKDLLTKIPEREFDLIYMYFILNKGQKQMSRILNITQGAVSLRLKKAIKRLQFLVNLPKVDVELMRQDLIDFLDGGVIRNWCSLCRREFNYDLEKCPKCLTPFEVKNVEVTIMIRMLETSCQSVVAREIGLSQCGVRHRFLRNLKKIEKEVKNQESFDQYYTSLRMVSENLNILREVEVPRWRKQRNIVLSDITHNNPPLINT